jgi:hypothetical protein
MINGKQPEAIKITLQDLDALAVPEPGRGLGSEPVVPAAPGSRVYGTITAAADKAPVVTEDKGSLLLKGWFYLGAAGLVGAFAGWAIAEPSFVDGGGKRWGNYLLIPLVVALMSTIAGVAESIVERAPRKAAIRALISLPLGLAFGGIFMLCADLVFGIMLGAVASMGVRTFEHPAFWIARGIAWSVFGATGGLVYGIIGQSFKKGQYGVLGGMIGAFIGGAIFDPIEMMAGGDRATLSRAAGFSLLGMTMGISMGIVESALKNRWLYVTSGPLAGKQFILYKALTTIGSEQQSDIYLFKDQAILPNHAVIATQGSRTKLTAMGAAFVAGSSVQNCVLQDGDLIQIGRYAFRYKEKARA